MTQYDEAAFGNITFVARPKSGGATIEVPAFIGEMVEAMFAAVTKNPALDAVYTAPEVHKTDEDRAANARLFVKLAKRYGETREAGILKIRQLPSKTLPAGEIRLAITRDLEANAAAGNTPQN
jgi:hypothetical protein